MAHNTGEKLILPALLFVLSFLLSCHGNGGRDRPPVLSITIGAPFADSVARGFFNAYSVSVVPGTVYKISMTGVSDDPDILYFGTDDSYTSLAECALDNTDLPGVTAEDCIVAAPGSRLYFGVDGTFLSASSTVYTVAVEPVLRTGINLSAPVPDETGPRQAVLYTLPAAAAGPYVAAITGLSSDADLHVFAGSLASAADCTADNTQFSGSTPEDCRLDASGGPLLLLVDSIFSSSPTVRYTAYVTPAPVVAAPANEGLPGSPVAQTVDIPRTGQVGFGDVSYYAAAGLNAGSRYTVSINGLTSGAELAVYTDNTFSTQASCLIENTSFTGITPESCTVTAASASLYFTVSADTASAGAAFITLVEPGP